jgi:uncharacterized protein YhbP (UPF0306 family)
MNSPEQLIRKHLKEARIMQLATVRDGQPWVCNVHYAPDDNCNLYWISDPAVRHSQELAAHPSVAAAIAIQAEQPLIGLQVEGEARQLTDQAEVDAGIKVYAAYQEISPEWAKKVASAQTPFRLYRLTPRSLTIFSPGEFSDDKTRTWQP